MGIQSMSENHDLYEANPQSTAIEDADKIIWFNWENGKNVVFGPDEIRLHRDHDGRLVQVENVSLKKEDIDILKADAFILSEKRDMGYYQNALKEYLESLNRQAHLVLFPAGNKCNFRCKYCYEDHDDPLAYTDEDIELISYFIKKLQGRRITIDFFGGEPLLKAKWILDLLSKTDGTIYSSTTTNGYLLSKELFSSLVDHRLISYQITMDGLPDEHNSLRPLFNGRETWQRIYDNIRSTKEVNKFFTIVIRVNFNERTLDIQKLDRFLELFEYAKNDLRYKFCFRAIDLYSEINQTTNSDCIENACSPDKKLELLTKFSAYAQQKGYFLADVGLYGQTGGLVCYASKINTYVINARKEILKCTVAIDRPVNKLSVLTKENIDSLAIENASKNWDDKLNRIEPKCCGCSLFFQCFARNCAFKNITSGKAACPYVLGKEKEIISLIMKDTEMCRNWRPK